MLAVGAGVKKRTINCVAKERNAIHFTIFVQGCYCEPVGS